VVASSSLDPDRIGGGGIAEGPAFGGATSACRRRDDEDPRRNLVNLARRELSPFHK